MNAWLYLICPSDNEDRFSDRSAKITEMPQEKAKTILERPARKVLLFFGLYVGA